MPTYGGKRYDFKAPMHNLTWLEDWPLRWVIEDENGTALSSFSGLGFTFYLLDRLDAANGVSALATAALHTETTAGSVPNVDITITAAEQTTAALTSTHGPYAYELWQTTASPIRRVAYGIIAPVV